MARTAAVLPCEQLCGRSNRRDRLSQTDDFVQIYLNSPQWVSGGLQVCTAIKHPSLCLKKKKKKKDPWRTYSIHAHKAGRRHQLLRAVSGWVNAAFRWATKTFLFFFPPPPLFYGAHTCTGEWTVTSAGIKTAFGWSCLINPHPLTLALQRGKGVRRRRRRRRKGGCDERFMSSGDVRVK